MKAIVVNAPGNILLKDIERATPGRFEVVVRVRSAGICGSDIPRMLKDAAHYYPIVLGHEFSGDVVEIGPDADADLMRTRVSIAPRVPCWSCEPCKAGLFSLCEGYDFIGSKRDGGLCEFVSVPQTSTVRLMDTLSYEQGAMLEPCTVALHALMRVRRLAGSTVAILGGGVIGLLAAQIARVLHADDVIVADVCPDRLQLAERLGFRTVDARGISPGLAISELTSGKGAQVVLETAGVPETQTSAVDAAGMQAEIVYVGSSHSNVVFTGHQFEAIARKELVIRGSWQSYSSPFPGQEWAVCQEYIGSGQVQVEPLISHRIPLSEGLRALEVIRSGQPYMKILLEA